MDLVVVMTKKPDISIIIATYGSPWYLKQCFDSLKKSCKQAGCSFEILVGIDSCEATLNEVDLYPDINFFFFKERVGCYVIKNSLVSVAKSENILFFDSDDIMSDDGIREILKGLSISSHVRFKFFQFLDKDNFTPSSIPNYYGCGVFAIKEFMLNLFVGFYPWMCAADTEFEWRLKYHNVPTVYIDTPLFYRRVHNLALTKNDEYGMKSDYRRNMTQIILDKSKSNKWDNPDIAVSKFISL